MRNSSMGPHMAKDHSDSERGNPLPSHGLLFPISSNGLFHIASCDWVMCWQHCVTYRACSEIDNHQCAINVLLTPCEIWQYYNPVGGWRLFTGLSHCHLFDSRYNWWCKTRCHVFWDSGWRLFTGLSHCHLFDSRYNWWCKTSCHVFWDSGWRLFTGVSHCHLFDSCYNWWCKTSCHVFWDSGWRLFTGVSHCHLFDSRYNWWCKTSCHVFWDSGWRLFTGVSHCHLFDSRYNWWCKTNCHVFWDRCCMHCDAQLNMWHLGDTYFNLWHLLPSVTLPSVTLQSMTLHNWCSKSCGIWYPVWSGAYNGPIAANLKEKSM